MIQRRLFSSTPITFAKRTQLAIKRKKANIQRQKVLQSERSPANFDPIIGSPTEFTKSLLVPPQVWSTTTLKDSLYFTDSEVKGVQSAVNAAQHARLDAEPIDLLASHTLPSTPQVDLTLDSIKAQRKEEIDEASARASEASSRILALHNANSRTVRALNTSRAVSAFARREGDTGSSEVQAAVLTVRIIAEQRHLQTNRKDVHGKRGFRGLIHQRQKILKYLRRESVERYFKCIARLGLTDKAVTTEITL